MLQTPVAATIPLKGACLACAVELWGLSNSYTDGTVRHVTRIT